MLLFPAQVLLSHVSLMVCIRLFLPFTFASIVQISPNQLEFKLTVHTHLAPLICKDNFASVATFCSFQNVTHCFAVPSCPLTWHVSAIRLWVMATEILSGGWIFGGLGMIHLPSHCYPGALWQAIAPGKPRLWCHALGWWWSLPHALPCSGSPGCSAAAPSPQQRLAQHPPAPSSVSFPGASSQILPSASWCHKAKGTDGVSVELLPMLGVLQSARQAWLEGYGCPALVLLPLVHVYVRKHVPSG